MSYILESLKKSDTERDSGATVSSAVMQTPDFLHNRHSASPNIFLWATITVAFIVLLVVCLFFFAKIDVNTLIPNPAVSIQAEKEHDTLYSVVPDAPSKKIPEPDVKKTPKQPPGISAINETKVKAAINVLYDAVSVAQAPASGQTKLLVTDSAVATDVSKNPSPVKPVDTTQAASRPQLAPADVSVIPKVYDLDSFSKRKIPAIDYGAHIFATDQASGFVILNGAKKHAGERLRNGIYIEKIAEDNVILSYNGVVFSLPAMKSWSYK